jgi:hypothetical protein
VTEKDLTVAVYFAIEFEVKASGEPEAVLKAAPDIQALEQFMTDRGYNFKMEMARVRRPRTAVKAQEREAAKKT